MSRNTYWWLYFWLENCNLQKIIWRENSNCFSSNIRVKSILFNFRRSGTAKMIDNGKGVLWIRGKFKDNLPNPYFRVSFSLRCSKDAIKKVFFQLTLSSHVSHEDFQLGYSMSGHVARSFEKYISYQITHLAFVRRRDFQQQEIATENNLHPANKNKSKTANFLKNLCRVYLTK